MIMNIATISFFVNFLFVFIGRRLVTLAITSADLMAYIQQSYQPFYCPSSKSRAVLGVCVNCLCYVIFELTFGFEI